MQFNHSSLFCLVVFEDICDGSNISQAQVGGLHITLHIFCYQTNSISLYLNIFIGKVGPESYSANQECSLRK